MLLLSMIAEITYFIHLCIMDIFHEIIIFMCLYLNEISANIITVCMYLTVI